MSRNPSSDSFDSQDVASPIDKEALNILCKQVGDEIQVFHVPEDPSNGIWSLSLPKSIYSTVFMLPVTVSMRTLRILCLIANVAFIFGDILETVNMYRWLHCVPRWKPKTHKKILNFCRSRERDSSSFPIQRYKNSSGLEVKKPAVGFTFVYRFAIIMLVILPKFILGLWLLIYGTGFVASATTNSDLILNLVALLFIIQIDDVSYDLLTPDVYKSWLQSSFEVTFFKEEENKIMRWLPFFCFWGIIACVIALYYAWCTMP